MTDEPLLQILAGWKGLTPLRHLLNDRGFLVPEYYRQDVVDVVGQDLMPGVETYWQEAAMEVVTSGGRVNSARRSFENATSGYRSQFLDDMAKSSGIPDLLEYYRSGGLHFVPGLIAYREQRKPRYIPPDTVLLEVEQQKRKEIERFGIATSSWGDKPKGAYEPHCSVFAEMKGFEKTREAWIRRRDDGLCFRYKIDNRRTWRTQLPILADVFHESRKSRVFNIFPDTIVPGYQLYEMHLNEEAAFGLLGLWAIINLLDGLDCTIPVQS